MKIETLNYNDLAFLAGITPVEAKHEIAWRLEIEETTKTGIPRVGLSDKIKSTDYDFTIRSNSRLEGKNQMEYLIKYYSEGRRDKQTLRKYSENKTFVKALKFTGKH